MASIQMPFMNSAAYHTTHIGTLCYSGYTSFDGRLIQGESVGLSLFYATCTMLLVWFFWTVVLGVLPYFKTPRSLFAGIVLVVLGSVGIAYMSGLQNQISHSSDRTLQFYAQDIARDHEVSLQTAIGNASEIGDLIPILRQQAQLYADRRDSELKDGAYTGTPGPGVVSEALDAITGRYTASVEDLQRSVDKIQTLDAQANTILNVMRHAAQGELVHRERMEQISGAGDAFRKVIVGLNERSGIVSVDFALKNLGSEIDIRSQRSANPKTARKQDTAMARIRTELDASTALLAPQIDRLLSRAAVVPPVIERINAEESVLLYAHKVIPQWLVSLAIDLWPGLLLVFGMIYLRTRGPYRVALEQTSLAEAMDQRNAIEAAKCELDDPDAPEHFRAMISGYERSDIDPKNSAAARRDHEETSTRPMRKSSTKVFKPEDLDDDS